MPLIDTEIENAIAKVTPELSVDQVCETLLKLDSYMARGRELKAQFDALLFDYIRVNGPVQIGSVRYWIGDKNETKNLSVRDTTEVALEAIGGDVDLFCSLLSVNAFKHGSCRKLFSQEQFDRCFKVEKRQMLDSDGKPAKVVHKLDEAFAK